MILDNDDDDDVVVVVVAGEAATSIFAQTRLAAAASCRIWRRQNLLRSEPRRYPR